MFEIIDVSERKGNGFNNLTGDKFGRLTVIGLSPRVSGRKSYWVCQCECGNKTVVRSDTLKEGKTLSCGCLKKEQDSVNLDRTSHNKALTPLHKRWLKMKERCYNPNNKSYENYGGRGIEVCDDWKNDFELFETWSINNGFEEHLSIERIDVDGNYEPKNCTWIPATEQAVNRRSTIWVEWNGMKKNLTQWADYYSINRGTMHSRYSRNGLRPPELFKPVK